MCERNVAQDGTPMGRLGTPEDLTGASPGTQTQDTSLGVLYELVC